MKNILIVNNLLKRFSENKGVGPIDFELNTGKIYSIIGPNASGKTTLIRSLCKLENLDSGEIIYPNNSKIDKNSLLYSAVFQQAEPWSNINVYDNIKLALKKVFNLPENIIREKVDFEIERFGLKEHYKSYSKQLSGGLKQRVVQARTFAMKPKFLFLDEPTSALDPAWTETFGGILKDYIKDDNMVLIIAHQMNFLKKISDYSFFLDMGVIKEQGNSLEFFDNPKHKKLIHFLENS